MAAEVTDDTAATAVTTGLGLVGGLLSVLLGPTQMSAWEKVGCIIAGGVCAFVGAPLVTTVFPQGGPRVVSLAGFVLGLSGVFLVRGATLWLSKVERRMPAELDRRTGIDTSEPKLPQPGKDDEHV